MAEQANGANGTLPAEAEVVVIGGGIVGAATTYFLAKRGVPVVLCERDRRAFERVCLSMRPGRTEKPSAHLGY